MAFGTGSAVAHRAVDSVMGPRTIQHETVPAAASSAAPELSKDACGMHLDAFTKVYVLNLCRSVFRVIYLY